MDAHLVSLTAPGSYPAEQYQGLRLTVERLGNAQKTKVIALTSPGTGDGKTLTAINLAGALAAETRVLLVDADLRRPSVATSLGLEDGDVNGLADIVSGTCPGLDESVRTLDRYGLSVVPAGSPRVPIHQILRSPRLEQFLQDARQRYDFVVVDTPPLLPVFDAAMLSRLADGVIVVVASGRTPRKALGEALNLLDASKVMGIVFNRDERPLSGYYDAYYRQSLSSTSRLASEA